MRDLNKSTRSFSSTDERIKSLEAKGSQFSSNLIQIANHSTKQLPYKNGVYVYSGDYYSIWQLCKYNSPPSLNILEN